jgi:CDP-glucose 4,6-dehydratase
LLGAKITGYALAPPTSPGNFQLCNVRDLLFNHYEADIRSPGVLRAALAEAAPEVISHLAAQSLVREGYAHPLPGH